MYLNFYKKQTMRKFYIIALLMAFTVCIGAKAQTTSALFGSAKSLKPTPANLGAGVANNITVSAWVYMTSTSGSQTISSWAASGNPQLFFRLETINSGFRPVMRMWNGSATAVTTNSVITINKWYNLAVTITNGVAKLYINGIDDTNPTAAAGTNNFPNFTIARSVIGASPDANADYFAGKMDNVTIWRTPLVANQVANVMNGSVSEDGNSPLVHLDFEGGTPFANKAIGSTFTITNSTTPVTTDVTNPINRSASQAITFGTIPAQMTDADPEFSPTVSSSSGLTVGLSSSNVNVASIVNGKIKPLSPGETVITAYQGGNDTYLGASTISQNLKVVLAVPGDYAAKLSGSNFLKPETNTPTFGATFSISGWIKPTAGAARTIASWGSSTGTSVASFFRLEGDNCLYYGQWASGTFKKVKTAATVSPNVWTHVAMVKDNDQIKIFINGIETPVTYTDGTAPMNNNNTTTPQNFAFGALYQNSTLVEALTGSIDNLTFYTSARTPLSISQEFANGVSVNEAGIWGYWDFNDKSSPTADVSVNNANRIVFQGGATYELTDINAVPVLSDISTGFVKNTTARGYIKSTHAGKVHWVVYPALAGAPSADDIVSGTGAVANGNFDYYNIGYIDYTEIKGLAANTAYKLYMVMTRANQKSAIVDASFATTNITQDISTQITAVQGVLNRLLPANASDFVLSQIPAVDDNRDVFEISTSGGKVNVKGSSATAITSGIRWYLSDYCKSSFSWSGDQTTLPSPLPEVTGTIRKETPYQYRYSLNYCTYNYTMSFWDWARWEREIDLMAMQGVNVVLAPIGSEAVWQQTLADFGYNFSEIKNFLAGPAYTAWWLMGNLQGEGAGTELTQAYIDSRVVLQNQILARMRSLGMKPVLQGYAGMVPINFATKQPTATVNSQPTWVSLYQRPPVLTGAMVDQVAQKWYEKSKALFGDVEFYGGDVFHEGGTVPTGLNLANYATQLQAKMLQASPNATWVLQAWQTNPKQEFINGLKKDQTLILDYSNDVYGFWKSRAGFGGYPWVYGVINNFGGRMGMYARLNKIASDVFAMQTSPNKGNNVGIGIAPEAIQYNPVSFDFMWDLAWETSQVNPATWITKFADRRYGITLDNTQKSWAVLNTTVLNPTSSSEGAPESIFNLRPSFSADNPAVSCCSNTNNRYVSSELVPAWINMMNAIDVLKTKATFKHDLVDLTRQITSNFAKDVYLKMRTAVTNTDLVAFKKQSDIFLKLMLDQDSLLRTNEEYLLGKWIDDARKMGSTAAEKDLFEKQARALPTNWATSVSGGLLRDYAHHEWAGLTKDYYRERWKLYINKLIANNLNVTASNTDFYTEFESTWINKKGNGYDIVANGREIEMSQYMYRKYANLLGYALTNNTPVVDYQSFNLPLQSKPNTKIGNVVATDADAAQTLTYSIYSQPYAGGLTINGQDGTLTLSNPAATASLNGGTYKIIVRVEDNGSPSYAVYREITITVGAQTGPAGIGKADGTSSLKTWLKADNITGSPANGSEVLSWNDHSGNGNHYLGSAGNAPTYANVGLASVNFSAVSGQFLSATAPASYAKSSAIVVANLIKSGSSQTLFDSDVTAIRTEMESNSGTLGVLFKGMTPVNFLSTIVTPYAENAALIFAKADTSAKFRVNVKNVANNVTFPNENNALHFSRLGTNSGSSNLSGSLYEVIVYNDTLNNAQKIIMNNYLAAKFGLTNLSHKIYQQDGVAQGGFKHNVAGIGQTNIKNVNYNARGTGILEVSNPVSLANNKFLIWGDDGGTMTLDDVIYPGDVTKVLNKKWRFNEVDTLGGQTDLGAVDLTFDLIALGNLANKEVKLLIDRNNNGLFTDETPIEGAQDLGNNLFRFEGVSDISNNVRMVLGLKSNDVLPVVDLVFNAKPENNRKVRLVWQTSAEPGNDYFTIEKSVDGNEWILVSKVASKGPKGGSYSLIDEKPYSGVSYYRIKQTDFNGKQSTFTPQKVEIKELNSTVIIYPNPTTGKFTVNTTKEIQRNSIKVSNVVGADITSSVSISFSSEKLINVDLGNATSGLYLIKVGSETFKVVKK